MNQNFEDMTIADLRKLHEQVKRLDPEIKTAEEMLEKINNKEEK